MIGSISRRYAKAILAIGIEQKTFEGLGREMDRLAKAYNDNAELREALQNPVFPLSQRRKLMEELGRRLAVSRTVLHLSLTLLDRGRVMYLPDIARKLRELVDEQAGRVRAKITSARPLDIGTEIRIKAALEKATGKTVVLEKQEDPSLIGGVRTQIGDTVYDGSVATQLANLRQQILTGT